MKNRLLSVLFILILLFSFPVSSHALLFDNLISFGGSLSDTGKFGVRFTDGPLWVETLATSFGADLFDYAYAGATTAYDNPRAGLPTTGLQWQLDAFLLSGNGIMNDDTLVTVWVGGNDFLQGRSFVDATNNIRMTLDKLNAAGAKDILVGNLLDIGKTPAALTYYSPELQLSATEWTLGFNNSLASVITSFELAHQDTRLYLLDAFSIFSEYTPGTQDWAELFWTDGFHPSAVGHQLIYQRAAAAVAPVPEPSTMLLLGAGLIGLVGARRKKASGEMALALTGFEPLLLMKTEPESARQGVS